MSDSETERTGTEAEVETDSDARTDAEADRTSGTHSTPEGRTSASEATENGEHDEERRTERREAEPAMTSDSTTLTETPLRVENLRKSFGGITAVDDASFDVDAGSLTGLIGPNGAGKSTTFNLITGTIAPDSGTVYFNGEDVTGLPPHRVARKGLARTFQIARQLADMTVLENVMLAPQGQSGESLWRSVLPFARRSVRREEGALLTRAWETLDFFDIAHLAHEDAGTLSGGQRKLLEFARALSTDPDMLLLDEPFAGVNPTLEKRLLGHIHELREQGYTFLIVEHDMDLIMDNCERVIVMHQGRVLADDGPEVILENEQVIEAYLGGTV
ncbi:ABC transporter ATP-binding protein [Halobacteriales archaeon QS_3_64_16]|nr:MAG: ABC transporter ATP-binding protein [Halobacteriales archaeon QS_3_64_16]